MKLKEWLTLVPTADSRIDTAFDTAVIQAGDGMRAILDEDTFLFYVAGRVHLLHMLLEYGIPEDLQEVYHGEAE